MYSKAKIAGHPVHPALVAFPIAFYTAALFGFTVYWASGDALWFRIGVVANIGGVITALIAAVPGFIDWAIGVPTGSPAKITGLKHMLLQVSASIVFLINAVLQWQKWSSLEPAVGASVILSLLGLVLVAFGAALGWRLVASHHVGVELTPEQELLEPTANRQHTPGGRMFPPVSQHR
ncbi:MAG: DUF2231 domain-containing protein [Kofleriaceae bacterium]